MLFALHSTLSATQERPYMLRLCAQQPPETTAELRVSMMYAVHNQALEVAPGGVINQPCFHQLVHHGDLASISSRKYWHQDVLSS